MHYDVKINGARIRTHDLWIRKRVCYPLHHSASYDYMPYAYIVERRDVECALIWMECEEDNNNNNCTERKSEIGLHYTNAGLNNVACSRIAVRLATEH